MEVSQKVSRCPSCNAVANPRWGECMSCGEPLMSEPVAAPVLCIFCRQPVKRGQPGTGALAGEDLHMDCLTKANCLARTEGELDGDQKGL